MLYLSMFNQVKTEKMGKSVKAILVDSKNETVTVINFDGDYDSIYELLGEHVEEIQWTETLDGDFIYYDLKQEDYPINSKGFELDNGICYYGNCLFVGPVKHNETGLHLNVKAKLNDVKKGTSFGIPQKVLTI